MHQNRENQAPHRTRCQNNPQQMRQPHIKHDTRRETRLQVWTLQRLAPDLKEIKQRARTKPHEVTVRALLRVSTDDPYSLIPNMLEHEMCNALTKLRTPLILCSVSR